MKNVVAVFDNTFIHNVCKELVNNRSVRREFAGWGRLHIYRRLPFLCIYRKPNNINDKDTAELLHGQSSYVLVRECDANSEGFNTVLEKIVYKLEKAFGAFLFFELWAAEVDAKPNSMSKLQLLLKLVKRKKRLYDHIDCHDCNKYGP